MTAAFSAAQVRYCRAPTVSRMSTLPLVLINEGLSRPALKLEASPVLIADQNHCYFSVTSTQEIGNALDNICEYLHACLAAIESAVNGSVLMRRTPRNCGSRA